MSRYIGHLHAGDVITTTLESGEQITVTIKDISFDPTWKSNGSTMISIHHEPSGNDTVISGANLAEWFSKTEWKKAQA